MVAAQIPAASRLFNVAIRGVTLVSRFLLIFFLAKFLSPADLGAYGLVAAAIGYALYPIGLDFYVFTTREIIKQPKTEWTSYLKDQLAISAITYVLMLPLGAYLFAAGKLPTALLACFFPLVIFEHLNQEIGRLLVAAFEQSTASVVLFLRSGLWAIVVTGLMYVDERFRNLDTVFIAWLVGSLTAFAIGILSFRRMGISGWHTNIHWQRIKLGLGICIPFFISTLCIRGLFFFDRYWIEMLAGMEVLGAYVLFIGITNVLITVLEAGVFSFSYPAMTMAWQQGEKARFNKLLTQLAFHTLSTAIVFSALSALAIEFVLTWLGKTLYIRHQGLFFWVLLSTALYALSTVPHYGLYAKRLDAPIIRSHVLAIIVFPISLFSIAPHAPILAVPISTCITFSLVGLLKAWALYINGIDSLAPSTAELKNPND